LGGVILRELRRAILVTFVLMAVPLAQAPGGPFVLEKAAAVDQSIRLLRELAAIARGHTTNYPSKRTQAKIRKLLEPLKSVDDLSRFALLASAMAGGQLAENQNYDGVFDYAQWVCVERIASIPGEEAHTVLESVLKPVLGRDGHPAEQFAELIARQKRLSESQ
jgi:hypothetical protein